jgi:HEAT repeat protein
MLKLAVAVLLFGSIAIAQTPAPKRPIAEVIAELSDKSAEVRSKAAWTLSRQYADSPERLDPLAKAATSDPDANVRSSALAALDPKTLGSSPRWTKLYLQILTHDTEETVRKLAALRLTPADASTADALLAAWSKETAFKVRNQIVNALVEGKVPKLVDILLAMVEKDPKPGRALEALARTGDPRAIPVLKAAAKRGVTGAVGTALAALAEMKDPAVDDIVLEFLDGSEDEQQTAIMALISSPRAADPRQTPKLVKIWQAQDKGERKSSVAKLKKYDNGEDDAPIHNITRLLRKIAETDQSPCDARSAAKGEVKAYLTKILPKTCGQ